MKYVIKTAHNQCDAILWQALYVHGNKAIEAPELSASSLLELGCTPADLYRSRVVVGYDELIDIFPDSEDFGYLLDYAPLRLGQEVYLPSGSHVVREKWEVYRPSGYYTVMGYAVYQTDLIDLPLTNFYSGHTVTEFKTVGNDEVHTWEDGLSENQSMFRTLITKINAGKSGI